MSAEQHAFHHGQQQYALGQRYSDGGGHDKVNLSQAYSDDQERQRAPSSRISKMEAKKREEEQRAQMEEEEEERRAEEKRIARERRKQEKQHHQGCGTNWQLRRLVLPA